MPPLRSDEYCTTREAATLLDVSLKTAQLWVENGILKAWKTPGGHRRIPRSSVQDMLAKRQQAIEPLPDEERETERYHLLIVEDDRHARRLYELTFAHWGLPLQLTMAENGFEGLLRIGEREPDMLITDLSMPGMDGFRLISTVSSDPRHHATQIVVVSGLSASEIRDQGGLPEHVTVLAKPIPFDQLRRIVEKNLLAKNLRATDG